MNKYIKLEKTSLGNYFPQYIEGDQKIWNLANFLTSNFVNARKELIKYIKESEDFETEGNSCWLERFGDTILIGDLFDPNFISNQYKDAFSINIDNFFALLEKWEELYKLGPNYIIITIENEIITIEGKD